MKARNVSSASLSPEAKRRLVAVSKALGMKQQELFGRLLDWFQAQDRLVQLIAVKQIPEGEVDDIVEHLYRKRHPDQIQSLRAVVERLWAEMQGSQEVQRPASSE